MGLSGAGSDVGIKVGDLWLPIACTRGNRDQLCSGGHREGSRR